ncbi:MAG: DUF3048 domain-containing protein [Coriobacteriia bacterium]|nr:DUF3048 domain-containing protein [Coriobacteriia bacterium]
MTLPRPAKTALLVGVPLVVALAVAIVPAWRKKEPEVTSKWPWADAERVLDKPAEPPRWPLTGLDAPDVVSVRSRVVSVKIENSAEARPQLGLRDADVVYEMLSEGGISRFNAMFHSRIPEAVAPVRSARMPDLQIVPQYKAVFAYSGANGDVLRRIKSSGIDEMEFGVNPVGYYRGAGRRAPHNLFLDIAKLREQAVAKRKFAEKTEVRGLTFSPSVETSAAASRIVIPFSPANRVEWTYDAPSSAYARVNNGKAHTDAGSGKQITATNVVVLWAKTKKLRLRDSTGSPTLDMELVGKNRAAVFRDGVRMDGTWEAKEDAPPAFRATDGTLITLRPGNTWFQVVPTSVNIAFD